MATCGIWKIERRIDQVIDYTTNSFKTFNKEYGKLHDDMKQALDYIKADYKTEKQFYVSGINCIPETALEQMQQTKKSYSKTDGILGFHAFQSFAPGEVTPEICHEIGVKLAEEIWGDRFEVVVSTHLNTNSYHNHFVINSVSFKDGKKYYDNRESYALIRHTSDEICKEYGLSVLKEKNCKRSNINYDNYYKKYLSRNNYYSTTKQDIDKAIKQAYSYEDFKTLMAKMGYEFYMRGTNLSVRRNPYKRNIRIARMFGTEYTVEKIKERIVLENETRIPFIEDYRIKTYKKYYHKRFKKAKIKGLRSTYIKYCYILRIYPKRYKKQFLTPQMRVDINRMEELSKEARLLNQNNISNLEELNLYKDKLENEISLLTVKRTNLWKVHNYESKNGKNKAELRDEIYSINNKIKKIRSDVKLCEDIINRTPKIKANLEEFEKSKERNEKEKQKNEYIK